MRILVRTEDGKEYWWYRVATVALTKTELIIEPRDEPYDVVPREGILDIVIEADYMEPSF